MSEHKTLSTELAQLMGLIPDTARLYIQRMSGNTEVCIRLVSARKSKLGDIKFNRTGRPPVITLNKNLHPDAMTFVLAHEIAHLLVFKKSGIRTAPHGIQWKTTFSGMLTDMLEHLCFSEVYSRQILAFSRNVRASVSPASPLHPMLFPGQINDKSLTELENIPRGSLFSIPGNKRVFEKMEKRKTRYVCLRTDNRKLYLVNSSMKVSVFE